MALEDEDLSYLGSAICFYVFLTFIGLALTWVLALIDPNLITIIPFIITCVSLTKIFRLASILITPQDDV